MGESERKGRIEQNTEKACVSAERVESTLLSSFVEKGKESSSKRSYTRNKRKSEEEIFSKSRNKKYSRGWVRREEEEEEEEEKKTRKGKSKRQQKSNEIELDETLRMQRRTRYLLIKMRMQQNLIDAYATEGWKGQSREKIRPDKELERARKHILNCKLGLRDAVRQLDLLSSVGCIEEKAMAPDGSIHHDHIFCAECNSREAFPDNDIILCDGTCNRGFHQKCLDPPLETESIPPGDQSWFCKYCDCKMEIIDTMNAQIGTHFPVDSHWQDIFNEEANLPIGSEATLNNEADWPSDDSEDGDYDPEMKENGGGSNSRSDSGGGGDNDDGESSSTSLSLASDGVALSTGSWEDHEFSNMVVSCETSNEETVCGPRQRKTVDYTKLYHEMFGKDAVLQEIGSEDEDWGPSDRRRRRRKESDEASALVSVKSKKYQEVEEVPEQSERGPVSVEGKAGRRPMFRIPRVAVERLRQVFAENELPSKAVRDSLSKELSLDPEKVSKWFKNTRYMALRNRKTESLAQPEGSKAVSGDSGQEAVVENNEETNEIQENVDETVVEEKNIETNEVQDSLDETIIDKITEELNETQDYVDETVMEKNTEELNENQVSVDETAMEKNTKTNETEDNMEEIVPLVSNDSTKQTTVSQCNDDQEEIQQAIVSFPTPIEDENQQYLEHKDSPHTLVPLEEVSSEMSLETPIEEDKDKEAESTMTEEEELEAVMEMLCRSGNMLLDVMQRLDRFKMPKGRKKLGKSSSSLHEEDSAVYVPIAEIKEKR